MCRKWSEWEIGEKKKQRKVRKVVDMLGAKSWKKQENPAGFDAGFAVHVGYCIIAMTLF